MKTKKTVIAGILLITAAIFLSACHRSVPCPVYAEHENIEEITEHS